MSGITITRTDSIEGFEALRPIWNELVDRGPHFNSFLTYEWLYSWWKTFGDDHELYILEARAGDEIVGLAPLMLGGQGGSGRILRFIGTPDSDYCDFLSIDPESTTPAFLGYLLAHRREWSKIDLEQISERSPTIEHIRAYFATCRIAHQFRPGETCHSYVYEGSAVDRKNLTLKRNKTLKWSINYFTRTGSLTLEDLRAAEEIGPHLDRLFHYHAVRWRSTFTPSKFLDGRHRQLYQAWVERLAEQNRLSLLVLKHDDTPIAFQFNFTYGASVYVYTLAHNAYYRRQSPGKILNHMALRHYVQAGFGEIDFTRGGESYKGGLTNRTSANYQLKIYRSPLRRLSSRLYERMKASPPAQTLARNVWLSDLRAKVSAAYTDSGVVGVLGATLGRAWRCLVDFRVYTIREHSSSGPAELKPAGELRLNKMGRGDLVAIASAHGVTENSKSADELARRLVIGQDCFETSIDGRTEAIVWGFRHECRLSGADVLQLKPREVMLADACVLPACGGDPGMPWLLAHTVDYYRSKGHRILTASSKQACFGRDLLAQLGFVPTDRKYFLKVLGVRLV